MLGGHLRILSQHALADEVSTFKTLESSVLGLLDLLLGFTFSMGVSRYDLRKNLEIVEANDIVNAWLRTAVLPEPLRSAEQNLLRQYAPVRLAFLDAGTNEVRINASLTTGAALQSQMWRLASSYAAGQSNAVAAQYLQASRK